MMKLVKSNYYKIWNNAPLRFDPSCFTNQADAKNKQPRSKKEIQRITADYSTLQANAFYLPRTPETRSIKHYAVP